MMKIETFRKNFKTFVKGWNWEVKGFLDKQNRVHPINHDTKVISTVFERFASPVVRSIATIHGYNVETSNQTTYPDFTLTLKDTHRIAIDIKTTYVRPSISFTLGSYSSFLQNNTKNILYPYDTYDEHWIVGFVYE